MRDKEREKKIRDKERVSVTVDWRCRLLGLIKIDLQRVIHVEGP